MNPYFREDPLWVWLYKHLQSYLDQKYIITEPDGWLEWLMDNDNTLHEFLRQIYCNGCGRLEVKKVICTYCDDDVQD